jgi:hypothetical protein
MRKETLHNIIPLSAVIITSLFHHPGMKSGLIFFGTTLAFGVIIVVARRFPSTYDTLREEGIWQRSGSGSGGGESGTTGGYAIYSEFKDIESCNVYRDNYKGAKFTVLKFCMKNEHRFFKFEITKPLKVVIVPEEINLDSVLQILRDKGVRIVEEPFTYA